MNRRSLRLLTHVGVKTTLTIGILLFLVFVYPDHSKQDRWEKRKLLQNPESTEDEDGSGVMDTYTYEQEQQPNQTENATGSGLLPPDVFFDEDGNGPIGAIIFHIIGVSYMFLALALVCDNYFVPALEVIIERLGVSPDVAGATFMAAGGSAPELFTSIIGVFITVSDVGIGTIVGSAVFNVLFVIAACAFASTSALVLTAWPLIRDTVFYSIALIMLVGFFADDWITWYEALILFMWYGAYVGFMKFNEAGQKKFYEMFPSLKKDDESDNQFKAGFKFGGNRKNLMSIMKLQVENQSRVNEVNGEEMKPLRGETKRGIAALQDQLKENNEESGWPVKEEVNVRNKSKETEEGQGEEEEEYEDPILSGPPKSLPAKIFWFISLPISLCLWLSLPDTQNPKRQKYFPITFIGSILWIAAFSYLMVWWATVAGKVAGISDALMGLTFLAAGTSVPDLITSVLVAKAGKGDMAVSSSIGSNIFDVTVGLPVPWLLWTAINQDAIKVTSDGLGCYIGMLFLMLIIIFISIIAFKWTMTKALGGVMMGMYVVFVIISLGISEGWVTCPI